MHRSGIRLLFGTTAFLAAALVFLVQPMVAKQLLPRFGGSPGVWNATVVFFQLALLAGYAIAHVSLDRLGPRRQVFVQLAIAAAAVPFLPIAIHAATGTTASSVIDHPAMHVLGLLAIAAGLPYLAVATVSPALQRWYSALQLPDSHDPYHLYVASNAGSLVGLLAFPLLLEPRLTGAAQARTWSVTFAAFAIGLVACALVVRARDRPAMVDDDDRIAHRDAPASMPHVDAPAAAGSDRIGRLRALRWIVIAAIPSALMLGVTTYITTDIASAPLLWVVPLALYLASFMLTFGRRLRVGVRVAGVLVAVSVAAVLLIEVERLHVSSPTRVLVHLAAMTSAALLAHATLYADRPPVQRLTTFYLLLSVGGAIGGMFVALAAPAWFDAIYEYPLLLAAVLLLRPSWNPRIESPTLRALATIAELTLAALLLALMLDDVASHGVGIRFAGTAGLLLVCAAIAALMLRRWGIVLVAAATFLAVSIDVDGVLVANRNFFGTVRVMADHDSHRMLHGTTLHGVQLTTPGDERTPTSYYTQDGPVGDAFDELQRDEPFVDVGVVGLGSGALLAYERRWQRWTFFEIDPAVIDAARDPELFTWLSGSQVDVDVVRGDARLQVEARERDPDAERFDLLVLDAYSSDSVPVHLLTVQAFRSWLDATTPHGVLLLHVSSRHLDLAPVVAADAHELGLAAIHRIDDRLTDAQRDVHGAKSHWIALARTPEDLRGLDRVDGWEPLLPSRGIDAWTDDYSNVVGAIRWRPDWLR